MNRYLARNTILLLGFAFVAACILSGCAGGVVYENANGSRGPEKVSIPRMVWPWSICQEAPK